MSPNRFLTALVGGLALTAASSAEPPSSSLTLKRIFEDGEFEARKFSARWAETGGGYTSIKRVGDGDLKGSQEIWLTKPGQDDPELLVPAGDLIPPDGGKPLAIEGYSFTDDRSLVLIYTNAKRVWRRKSRGDYWLLDRGTRELRQLGGEGPPSSLMFAKISPQGTHVAYVRGNNIFLESLLDHSIRPLTESKKESTFSGRFDWVYEEELLVRDGFRWSPDGTAIAYWQFDESGVRQQTMVDHVSGLYPKLQQFAYPKVGQQNASCRIGVVEIASRKTRWMQIPGDPRNHYLARVEWADNSKELVVQQLNRAQTVNRVMLAKRSDGSVRTILEEKDEDWVSIHDEMHWVDDGKAFTWISERGGWRQLYLVTRDGKKVTCLTPGAFDVIRLLGVDQEHRWAWFIASPGNPAERYLYRVGLDGTGFRRVTPRKAKRGTHSYQIAPDGKHAFLTSSTFERPPATQLISLPAHERVELLEANKTLRRKVKKLDRPKAEFFYVDIGNDVSLHARCLLPPQFDRTKKYPLLVYVYGEPAGQVVRDSWGGRSHLWHLMLAQQGYVVMSFDNRGTNAPRGRDWRRAAARKIGILGPADQAAAVRAVLKDRPYLDPERVGSWGWSGGGSTTLHALFKYPDLYSTGIAVASVPNQRHYDTIYQERYMGLLSESADAYREGSPIHFAHQLKGDLLLIHGAQDDNCHYQTYLKLVDTLIRHNKPFRMMTYPRGTHSISEGRNTTRHVFSTMTRFLHDALPPGPEEATSP